MRAYILLAALALGGCITSYKDQMATQPTFRVGMPCPKCGGATKFSYAEFLPGEQMNVTCIRCNHTFRANIVEGATK